MEILERLLDSENRATFVKTLLGAAELRKNLAWPGTNLGPNSIQ